MDLERFVGVFQCPHMLRKFGLVSCIDMSEGCSVIYVSFFKISSKCHESF